MSITNLRFCFLSISILIISSTAQNTSFCSTSTCGTTTITNPFRLTSDPPHCGFPDPHFALDCRNNQPIFTSGSQRYNVQAITYSNYSIRLTDPNLIARNYSTCPTYSSIDDGIYSTYMSVASNVYNLNLYFITCSIPVNNPLYVEDPTCGGSNSSRIYSYIGRNIIRSELEASCVVDKEAIASSTSPFGDRNYPYSTVHDLLSFGFERSWYHVNCGDCDRSKGVCSVENNRIRCRHYCYEDTPFEERSFRCKLDYYAPLILLVIVPAVIGGILVVRCMCGIAFVIGMVISGRRKKRASMAGEAKSIP